MAKRAFDIVVSLLALAILAPVLIGVALLIKTDSKGPIFFRQDRVGRSGKVFRIFKFRTMRPEVSSGAPQITIGADARITRLGQYLRAYKLDELPQLLNVLAGQMSIVGPRPEVPKYVAAYPEELKQLVLSMRPGITDLASIKFRRESELLATSSDPEKYYVQEIMPEKLRLYADYARNHSFWRDLQILWLTAKTVVFD